MKFNKKLVVTSLSTVLGLGIVGSITGTVAWYQYSTRGTASLIGMSAGESGVLQLSADSGLTWKRDVASNDFFYTSKDNIRNDQKVETAFDSTKDFYNGTAWDLYDKKFTYQNVNGWAAVYAYVYNEGEDPAEVPQSAWPGIELTRENETSPNWNFEVDGYYQKVIFNDGSVRDTTEEGTHKTDPIDFVGGKHVYNGTAWSGDSRVYYYQNTNNWPSVRAYAWTGSGDIKNAAFPGQLMTIKVDSENAGEDIYSVTLPRDYESIMFFDGSNYREDNKLRPCTWGGINKNVALPDHAYGNPVLGKKEMTDWKESTSDVDYFQFTVQLKTVDKSSTDKLVAKEVWLTDIVLRDAAENQIITDALRMHLKINDGTTTTYMLISSTAVNGLDCHGQLDLDGDGAPDTIGGYDWNPDRDQVVDYGNYIDNDSDPETPKVVDTTKQYTYGIDDIKATSYDSVNKRYTNGISLGSTVAQAQDPAQQKYLTITVTVWLEGWAQLDPYASPSLVKAVWDPDTLGRTIHAGLTFDVGDKAFTI